MNKKHIAALLLLSAAVGISTAEKKILDHADFDRWEKVYNYAVSNNGEWSTFAVNPQEGDGTLYFNNNAKGNQIEIRRGYKPLFSADSRWGFALIKPPFADTRKAKIAKKKDFDLPQDSLVIIDLRTGRQERIGNVISYEVPKDGGDAVAWLSCDTLLTKPKDLKEKKGGRTMVAVNLATSLRDTVPGVEKYVFSKDGATLAYNFLKIPSDTASVNGVGFIRLAKRGQELADTGKRWYGKPVFNEAGNRLAFVASDDSVKTGTKSCSMMIADLEGGFKARWIYQKVTSGKGTSLRRPHSDDPVEQERLLLEWKKRVDALNHPDLYVNQYSNIEFSANGNRLIVGVAPKVAPDDTTIVDFENPKLDIWRWDAPLTPPQENDRVEELRKKTYPLVILDVDNIFKDEGTSTRLVTSDPLAQVTAPDRWDADWALIATPTDKGIPEQWDYQFPVTLTLKNIVDASEREVGTVPNEMYALSPAGKYVIWFDNCAYHVYDIADDTVREISRDVAYPLWKEDNDIPLKVLDNYGIMGWSEDDSRVLVYDRYDVWSLDPKGVAAPVCITAGEGRKRNLKMRMIKTDPEARFVKNGEVLVFSLFAYGDKRQGLASATYNGRSTAPKIDFLGEYSMRSVRKARNAAEYSWIQENFSTSPNVYVSSRLNPSKTKKVTNSNPQMANYRWGTAQLFRWTTYDGKPAEGILYLPEDFNPDEEYPMIAYFYETYTEDLYTHFDMEPSWSWINFPFYVSRGYAIFVPDIHFNIGTPGESSYNYVCSGVEAVCRQFPNIDIKRVGIDGQSWGGYQTAYLVTRTNMFACAGSGAPVSNMTSAFGGIRWGSGDSRQAQYEVGQSRIGQNLWEVPELYIANSPVFHANRVETPLLIMHNDNDGAVPWYQGIEMFMALRRLGKPVWMLQYNGEAHNLKERRNRKDITRRLQQFFDHYLKGDPMPEWMINGIPAVRKGQELGY